MKKAVRIVFIICLIGLFSTLFILPIDKKKPEVTHLKVVSTIFPAYDFARTISQDVELENKLLIKPGIELHGYEPSPQDIIDIKESHIFIYNGGESEEWVEKIIPEIDKSATIVIRMMDTVELKAETTSDALEKDDDSKQEQPEYDEHIWVSPNNAIHIAEAISQGFKTSDPDNSAIYQHNLEQLKGQLKHLDDSFRDLSKRKTGTIIIADRFPFKYLVDEYGFDYIAAFPGCSEQTEASAKTIAELNKTVEQSPQKIIFNLELSNTKIAQSIAKTTNARILTLHSLHNLSIEDFNNGRTYVDIMTDNLNNISEALHERITD